MRSISHVYTSAQRLALREKNQRRARRTCWRILAVAGVLRSAFIQVFPMAGASGWWLCMVSLLLALVPYWLCCLLMKKLGASTLPDALRAAFGRVGVWVAFILVAAVLLWDALCTMTALVTLFTQGIGARGTQLTLAVLTGCVMLLCLQRDGLIYGLQMLRWPLGILLVIAVACRAGQIRGDHLFPPLGQGMQANLAALRAGAGLGWPLVLLLMEEPAVPRVRWRDPLPAWGLAVGILLLITLTIPHEMMLQYATMAQGMLMTAAFLSPAAQLAILCLWMVGLFLLLAVETRWAADAAMVPSGRESPRIALLMTAMLVASQIMPPDRLWPWLAGVQPWLVLPLVLACAALGLAAIIRQRRRSH